MEKKFAAFETADDFILDGNFQDWVCHPRREEDQNWNRFFELYPEKKVLADEARAFLQAIEFPAELPEAEKRRLWLNIEEYTNRVEDQMNEPETLNRRKIRGIQYWIRTAAAVLLLTASLVMLYTSFFNKTTYRTAYGEITTITLPDSSIVTLNANSELVIKGSFFGDKLREVWLEGEAFFKVRRISRSNQKLKFLVHTTDLDVTVLGTSFNVYERKAGTEVVLQSGRVGLDLHTTDSHQGRGEVHLLMQPGDLVRYDKNKSDYRKQKIATSGRLSWVDKKLFMEDTPFSQVVKVLKEHYGEHVRISDSTILEEKVTGELPLTDKKVFLEALSTTMQLNIEKDMQNNSLLIERK